MRHILKSLFVLMAVCTALSARAQGPAYSFSSALITTDGQMSIGFVFSTLNEVIVRSLGYYDHQGNGFLTPHEVGIFDATTGTLLTSTLLNAGTEHNLDGKFRYKAITPIVLPAGKTFILAATTYGPSDPWAYGQSPYTLDGFTYTPYISIGNFASLYLYQSDNILRRPTVSG